MAHSPTEVNPTGVQPEIDTELSHAAVNYDTDYSSSLFLHEEGAAKRGVIGTVAVAAVGVLLGGYLGAHSRIHFPDFGIPGLHKFVAAPPSASVQAEAALKSLSIGGPFTVVSGVGYAGSGIEYHAAVLGDCWKPLGFDINPSCVRQVGVAVYGSPPEGMKPPSQFKKVTITDANGKKEKVYPYTADPELDIVSDGIHFALGHDKSKGSNAGLYPIIQVDKNKVHTIFIGQPKEQGHMNAGADIGSIAANPDTSSESDVVASVAKGNFENACTPVLEELMDSGFKLEGRQEILTAAQLDQAENTPASIETAKWLFRLAAADPVVEYGTFETVPTAGDSAASSLAAGTGQQVVAYTFTPLAGKFTLPKVFVDTKESFAKVNQMDPSNVTWDVNQSCQMTQATKDRISELQNWNTIMGLSPIEVPASPIPNDQAEGTKE